MLFLIVVQRPHGNIYRGGPPAYWRRSHGMTLTKWCLDHADLDSVGTGVSAASMGKDLFTHMKFKEWRVLK
jgi:hypothetical protein